MFLVHAEDDGLGEAVRLLEEFREVPGDGLGARLQRDDALEILGAVFVVGDLPAVSVNFALARPPASRIDGGDDAVDPVRRKKAVIDALPQAVCVERIAEITIGVPVVFAQRRGRHADLESGSKYSRISRQLLSSRALPRWHSSTMIRSKKSRRIFPVQARPVLVLGDCLVDGEVHLAAFDRPRRLDLVARVAERREVLSFGSSTRMLRSARKRIRGLRCSPVRFQRARPELPADLEGDDGLAGPRRHRQKNRRLPRDGLDRSIDGDLLVVPRRLAADDVVWRRGLVGL